MCMGLEAPIVSEFYYQTPQQMAEDRKWCTRVFLHAYAVGFPDVGGSKRTVGADEESGSEDEPEVDEAGMVIGKRDEEQEWHACICPLTVELRDTMADLTPKDDL